jgi:hypothetical protein
MILPLVWTASPPARGRMLYRYVPHWNVWSLTTFTS